MKTVRSLLVLLVALLLLARSVQAAPLPELWEVTDLGSDLSAEFMALNNSGVAGANQFMHVPLLGQVQVLPTAQPASVGVLTDIDDNQNYVGFATTRAGGPASYCTEPLTSSPVLIPWSMYGSAVTGQCGQPCMYQSPQRTACAIIALSFFEQYVFEEPSMLDTRDFAASINSNWQVVGAASKIIGSERVLRAFLSSPETGMVDLGALGGPSSAARRINFTSVIVGEAQDAQSNYHAFLLPWGNGSMQDLGTLGGDNSWAKAVNNDSIVVGSSEIESGSTAAHAFVYTVADGMVDLNDRVTSSTATLEAAVDINTNGDILTYGDYHGERRAFLLTPFYARSPLLHDFDGDTRGDFAVWRPATGEWFVQTNPSGLRAGSIVRQWGLPGDKPLRGDYDGDGQLDLVVWRPGEGNWYLCYSADSYSCSTPRVQQFGLPGDYPLSGDIDGDEKNDFIVWRPLLQNGPVYIIGQWYYLNSATGESGTFQFGLPGDIPVIADFDGDGQDDAAVYRPASGEWFVRTFLSGQSIAVRPQWGLPGDHPLPADYDGDGKADVAVWRPSNGTWYVRSSRQDTDPFAQSSTGIAIQYGLPGDKPIAGSFNGSSSAQLGVWRPAFGNWYIRGRDGIMQWGLPGDVPVGVGTKDLM